MAYGAEEKRNGGTYFYCKESVKVGKFGSLVNRILHEVMDDDQSKELEPCP